MARGRYGSNKGDIWLVPDCETQRLLDAQGEGYVLIHEMIEHQHGRIAESRFVTSDPKLIALAMAGYERYAADRAA
jgi:hypothetical protein